MMRIAPFAAFACLAAALPSARQVGNLNTPDRIPGEFLIVLHPHVGKSSNFVYANKMAGRIVSVSEKISIVSIFSNLQAPILHVKTSDEAVMSQLFALDEVYVIDSNLYQSMIQQCSSQSTRSEIWGLSRVSSRYSPDFGSASYSYSSSGGSGVRVYILDTGVRLTHEDFRGRGEFGVNIVGGNDDDNNGHGTHCAGVASGTQFGISKGSTVVAVKIFFDNGYGTTDGAISGISWMVGDVRIRGVRGVGGMFYGGVANDALDSAVNSADAAGVPVVVPAGNNDFDACSISPARTSGAITVGATDINDNLSSFSGWGNCVDILAPGTNILSASHLSDTRSTTLSGTSMAGGHVAGKIANYLAANPNASPGQVKAYLSSSATANVINMRGTSGTPNLLQHSSCT